MPAAPLPPAAADDDEGVEAPPPPTLATHAHIAGLVAASLATALALARAFGDAPPVPL